MTEKQRRFIDYYLQTANAAESARSAGYSKKTDYSIGERLLRNVEVRKAIEERLKQMESNRLAETREVLEHLTKTLRGEVTEVVVTNSGKKFTVPVSERDRLKAADMLLKVFGEYRDKVDVKVDGAQLFVDTLTRIQGKLDNA